MFANTTSRLAVGVSAGTFIALVLVLPFVFCFSSLLSRQKKKKKKNPEQTCCGFRSMPLTSFDSSPCLLSV